MLLNEGLCSAGNQCEGDTSVPCALQQHMQRGRARHLQIVSMCCINEVCALQAANVQGIPVFNAPFSNTRSVAELVICEVIALARQLGDRSAELHR